MEKISFVSKYIKNGKVSFQRFPLAMAFACLFALVAIYNNHNTDGAFLGIFRGFGGNALQMVLVLGFFLSIAINRARLSLEKIWVKANPSFFFILYILGLGVLVAMYISLRPLDSNQEARGLIFTYIGILLATIAGCTVLGKLTGPKNFEAYVARIFRSEALAFTYSLVLFAGLGAVLFAINHLLGLQISGKIYTDLFFILFGPVQAGFFLASFPEEEDTDQEKGAPLAFILQRIISPLLMVYTLILYLYFVKMLVQGEIPSNLIRNLFIWYGIVSVASLFFHSRYMEDPISNWMVTKYAYFVLPTIGVYFYSLGLRIRDVGFTEFRYLGLLFGLYVAISLFVFIRQKGRDNRILPLLLVVFLLFASVGPQSMTAVSRKSQERRLLSYLLSNDMLQDGQILAKKKVKEEDQREMTSIVTYLVNNHDVEEIKYLPKDFTMDQFSQVFGFEPEGPMVDLGEKDEKSSPGIDYYSFSLQEPLDIKNYEKYYLLNFSNTPNPGDQSFRYFTLAENKGDLVISRKTDKGQEEFIRLPLKEISGKYKALSSGGPIQDPNDFSFEGQAQGLGYKLVFTSLSVDQDENNYYMEMVLLTKKIK